ncbi:MAG: metal ABC transporter substrate-binding protein [Promethearchaeota archaeon]
MTDLKQKHYAIFSLALFLAPLILSSVAINAHAQTQPILRVAVSVPSLAGIAQEVGGPHVNTSVLLNQETEPHAFTLTPEVITKADDADLLVLTGHFAWEEELANLTSTPFITLQSENALENYEEYGAVLSPMPGQESGGSENGGNLHGFWLLPRNAVAIANATRAALTAINSTMSDEWTSNFNAFVERVDELQNTIDMMNDIYGFSGLHAITVFPAEAYVAETFGIKVDAVLQIEDITLSGAKLLDVQNAIRNGSIRLILGSDIAQFQTGGEFAYQLQADYGGILIWWRTVFYAESEYFWMMNYNLGALASGLKGRAGAASDGTINIGLIALSSVLGVLVTVETVLIVRRAKTD